MVLRKAAWTLLGTASTDKAAELLQTPQLFIVLAVANMLCTHVLSICVENCLEIQHNSKGMVKLQISTNFVVIIGEFHNG